MALIIRSENSASITTPEAGKATLFYDGTENVMKFKDYTGVSYIFGSGSGQNGIPFVKTLAPSADLTTNTTASYSQLVVIDLNGVALTISGVFVEAPPVTPGGTFGVKIKEATNTKFVTITTPLGSTALFNSSSTHKLGCDGEFVQFASDGTNWIQTGHGFDQFWNTPNINPRCNPAAWYTFIGPNNVDCYTDRSGNGRHLLSAVSTSTGNSLAHEGVRSDLSSSFNTVWSLFSGSAIIGSNPYTVAVLAKRPAANGGLPVFSCPIHAGGSSAFPAQLNFLTNALNWFSNIGTPTNQTLFSINSYSLNDTDQWYVYWLTVNSTHNTATAYVNNYLGAAITVTQVSTNYPNTNALNFGAWNAPTQAAGLWLRILTRKEMSYVTRCLLGPSIRA